MHLSELDQILVFGGSFDPPHMAHVALPLMAADKIGADAVAFVPNRVSPFKQSGSKADGRHRLAMLRLAVAAHPKAVVLTDELERDPFEPSYTVQTLRHLRARLPDRLRLRLLIGADQLRRFEYWKEPEEIVSLAEPLVMLRPPDTRHSLSGSIESLAALGPWEDRLIDLPRMDLSSTALRHQLAQGRGTHGLLHPAVEAYARRHHLYEHAPAEIDEYLLSG